ncbi:MAG: hypothetical protein WA183_07305 [Chthoniobacterales bacterium]
MPDSEDALGKARQVLSDAIERNIDRGNQSAAQLDRTLITLSSGALVFSMTVGSKLGGAKCILAFLFFSWICFLAAITLVILSMRSQQNAAERAVQKAAKGLKLLEDDPEIARQFLAQQKSPEPITRKEVERHEVIGCLNSWALVAFGAGMLSLAIFAAFNLCAANGIDIANIVDQDQQKPMMTLLLFAPIVLQFFGTLLVWFETERISAVIGAGRITITDDPKWKKWYYNSSKLGFALLFIGILLQSVCTALTVSGCR